MCSFFLNLISQDSQKNWKFNKNKSETLNCIVLVKMLCKMFKRKTMRTENSGKRNIKFWICCSSRDKILCRMFNKELKGRQNSQIMTGFWNYTNFCTYLNPTNLGDFEILIVCKSCEFGIAKKVEIQECHDFTNPKKPETKKKCRLGIQSLKFTSWIRIWAYL